MIGTEFKLASYHVFRYGKGSHQCTYHTRRARHMLCAHCAAPGECEHLVTDRCRCEVDVFCSECLFEAEGGYL